MCLSNQIHSWSAATSSSVSLEVDDQQQQQQVELCFMCKKDINAAPVAGVKSSAASSSSVSVSLLHNVNKGMRCGSCRQSFHACCMPIQNQSCHRGKRLALAAAQSKDSWMCAFCLCELSLHCLVYCCCLV